MSLILLVTQRDMLLGSRTINRAFPCVMAQETKCAHFDVKCNAKQQTKGTWPPSWLGQEVEHACQCNATLIIWASMQYEHTSKWCTLGTQTKQTSIQACHNKANYLEHARCNLIMQHASNLTKGMHAKCKWFQACNTCNQSMQTWDNVTTLEWHATDGLKHGLGSPH